MWTRFQLVLLAIACYAYSIACGSVSRMYDATHTKMRKPNGKFVRTETEFNKSHSLILLSWIVFGIVVVCARAIGVPKRQSINSSIGLPVAMVVVANGWMCAAAFCAIRPPKNVSKCSPFRVQRSNCNLDAFRKIYEANFPPDLDRLTICFDVGNADRFALTPVFFLLAKIFSPEIKFIFFQVKQHFYFAEIVQITDRIYCNS